MLLMHCGFIYYGVKAVYMYMYITTYTVDVCIKPIKYMYSLFVHNGINCAFSLCLF